jgi:hypothetical protein
MVQTLCLILSLVFALLATTGILSHLASISSPLPWLCWSWRC